MSFLDAREHGAKPGSGGVANAQQEGVDRRERLRRLALETIDLSKDPYYMRNHLGQIECRLCLTLHSNEGNYLAHTQVWHDPPGNRLGNNCWHDRGRGISKI